MLKSLHKNDTQTTPFVVTKNWELSNVTNEELILMEHDGKDGLPVAVEYLEYTPERPIVAYGCNVAKEQQTDDKVLFRSGLKQTGIFYPEKEPKNLDGTYQRVVYSQIANIFYNNFRDPTKIWGLEELDFEKSQTKKFVADRFKLFDIPRNVFGEKILENTVVIYDTTTDNNYIIKDDGHCNLFAVSNLFSKQQELGEYKNYYLTGSSTNCDYYNAIEIPNAPILAISNNLCGATIILRWNYNAFPVDTYVLKKSLDNGNTYPISMSILGNVYSYVDTNVVESSTYYYKIYAENTHGTSSYSNIVSSSTNIIYWNNDPDIWNLPAICGPVSWSWGSGS